MKIECNLCHEKVGNTKFYQHIINKHNNLSQKEKIYLYQNSIPNTSSTKLLYLIDEFIQYFLKNINTTFQEYFKIIRWYVRSFTPFCNTILKYRQLNITDLNIFFNLYLPYRKTNKYDQTSYKLAMIYCNNNQEEAKKFYDKVIKQRNPFTGHTGELSPWSKNFIGYKQLSQQEKEFQVKMHTRNKIRPDYKENIKPGNNTLEYYLNKGYTSQEAKQLLHDRQATNTLEKYTKKYGIQLGQKKFQQHLNKLAKALSQIQKKQYSKISQELFFNIISKLNINKQDIYFAENNGEFKIYNNKFYAKLDFYIPKLNKWIEFNGDYWHNLPGKKQKDIIRNNTIKQLIPNIQLKEIQEVDYRHNKDKIINECVDWIKNEVEINE